MPRMSPAGAMRQASEKALQWTSNVFGSSSAANIPERGARLLEEVLELAYEAGVPRRTAAQLLERAYSRNYSGKVDAFDPERYREEMLDVSFALAVIAANPGQNILEMIEERHRALCEPDQVARVLAAAEKKRKQGLILS